MPNRPEQEQSFLSRVGNASKAALAVGAGAALAYRGGGNRALTDGARGFSRFLSTAQDSIAQKGLRDIEGTLSGAYRSALEVPGESINLAQRGPVESVIEGFRARGTTGVDPTVTPQGRAFDFGMDEFYQSRVVGSTVDYMQETYQRDQHMAHTLAQDMFENLFKKGRGITPETSRIDRFGFLSRYEQNKVFSREEILDTSYQMEEALRQADQHRQRFLDERTELGENIFEKMIDPDELARNYGRRDRKTPIQDAIDTALGDQPATVGDILDRPDRFTGQEIQISEETLDSPVEALQRARQILEDIDVQKAEDFRQIQIPGLRISPEGDIRSFDALPEPSGEGLLGRILKVGDIKGASKAPLLHHTPTGRYDPQLAAAVGEEGRFTSPGEYLRILDRTYEITGSELRHIEELDDTYLMHRETTTMRSFRKMAGLTSVRERDSRAARALGLGESGAPNLLERFLYAFRDKPRDPRYQKNIIDEYIGGAVKQDPGFDRYVRSYLHGEQVPIDHESALGYYGEKGFELDTINRFFAKSTYEIDSSTAYSLRRHMGDTEGANFIEALTRSDQELLEEIASKRPTGLIGSDTGHIINKDLTALVESYRKDPKKAMAMTSMRPDKGEFFGGQEQAGYTQLLRREMAKEGLMRQQDDAFELIEAVKRSGEVSRREIEELERLATWGDFQRYTGGFGGRVSQKAPEDMPSTIQKAADFFEDARYREITEKLASEKPGSIYHSPFDAEGLIPEGPVPDYMHMRRTINPLDILKDLHDTEKMKAAGKQFISGRDDIRNITTLSTIPYFALNRISDGLDYVGLGISPRHARSTGDMAKNMMLRRVLPIAAGLTYFDYMDDVSEEVTGTSLTGAAANALAGTDLAMRSVADATGISTMLDRHSRLNPMYRYWFGEGFQDREEREEWYQEGYSPMRRSRFWYFGSLNEFRGRDIAYWQPNYLRRAHADPKDASLYDGFWDKWSHSWFPTPTHPFSPLRALTDPYHLEEKHKEERPYPMTGTLFERETPWGAILNPTLGEIIKPQRRMHEDRLGDDMIDVRALIEQRNREQKQEAMGNLIRYEEGRFDPIAYTPYDAPTMSQRIVSIETDGDIITDVSVGGLRTPEVMEAGELSNVLREDAGHLREQRAALEGAPGATLGMGTGVGIEGDVGQGELEGVPEDIKRFVDADSGNIFSDIAREFRGGRQEALESISEVNLDTKMRAERRRRTEGVVTPESIYSESARYGSHVPLNEEAVAELRELEGGQGFINDIAYSARYMTGIYGYAAHRLTPSETEYRLADAGEMDSFVRDYWDAQVGGLGGGTWELFRRFFPFPDRWTEAVNPLMNQMPNWLPDRFRFGDPFTEIPSGEARLPGAGYEELYDLSPDQYGDYGALDRMRILADIAPFSQEYRTWREIASRTVQDPEGREEMQRIRERVREQSRGKEFEEHRFLGRGTDRIETTVEEVMNNNYFRVTGDDNVYRMAGITVGPTEYEDNVLAQHLAPGMEVVLETDENIYKGVNEDRYGSINAAVFSGGININRQLLDSGLANERESDTSAAAMAAQFTPFERFRGSIYEAIGHLPIPYIHTKYMRIQTPLEAYRQEQIYGTDYSSWTNPIQSMVIPTYQRAISSWREQSVGLATWAMFEGAQIFTTNKKLRGAANIAFLLGNRGAAMGSIAGAALTLGKGSGMKWGGRLGAAATLAGYAYTRADSPIEATVLGGLAGEGFNQAFRRGLPAGRGGAIGAMVGLGISGLGHSMLDEGLTDPWIPERTQKRWEMQEYFDRLRYLKYEGLYNTAARRANLYEDTDVKTLVDEAQEKEQEKEELRGELLEYRHRVSNMYPEGDPTREIMLKKIDARLNQLDESSEVLIEGGKYNRAALAYRQAADATIYGLNENASWSQLLRATPPDERDYIIAFADEKDPDKREEIRQYMSPYQQRILDIAWGNEVREPESMHSFFKRHHLPGAFWPGWRPEQDLDDIQVKTIENEGMLLSDFGHYESELRESSVQRAPVISSFDEPQDPISTQISMATTMQGLGLTGVDIDIEPSQREGTQVFMDTIRIGKHRAQDRIGNIFGGRLFG